MGIFNGLLTMLFWGVAIFLAAIVSRKIGNILTLFWMQFFGFIVGLIYFLFNARSLPISSSLHLAPILIAIAILQVVAYLAFYKGLEKGQVSLVSPIGASWSLITAILSIVVFKETLKSNQLLAIIAIIGGIIIISFNFNDIFKSKGIRLLAGVKEGIVSILGWGISLFLLIPVSKELGWFLPAFLFRMLILVLLSTLLLSTKKPFIPKISKFPWLLLLLIGLFDICAFFAYSLGVSSAYGSIIAPISSANTLVTIMLGVFILKEKIDLRRVIGIGAIVCGLILISL